MTTLTRRDTITGTVALIAATALPIPVASADPEYADLQQRLHAVLAHLRTLPEMPEGDPGLRILWHVAHMSPQELTAFAALFAA